MNKFDKELLKKLDGYSSPVNSNLWENIANNLPEQDNSSRNWWLPAFGIITLLIGIAAITFFLNTSDITEGEKITQSVANGIDNPQYHNSASSELAFDKDGSDESSDNNVEVTVQDYNNISKSKNDVVNKLDASNLENVNQTNLSSRTINNRNSSVNNKTTANNRPLEANDLALTNSAKPLNDIGTANLYQQYTSIIKKSRSQAKDEGEIVERKEEASFEFLPFETSYLKDESELSRLSSILNNKRTICPTFSNLRFGIFAEAFYSNDFGMRALSYNSPVTETDYLNARNRTETAQYSFSAGARFSFLLPSGIGAKTGITYSQINESFNYEDPNHKQTKTVTIKEYKWENNVIVDSTEVTKTIDVPGKLNVLNQNRYKIIDLPVLFTYEWGYKNRFYYAVTGGPMFNIRFTQKGKFLNPETLTPVDFSTETGNYKAFNTNIGTSVYLSFAVNYQLGNGVDVFVEPNMRHFLKNATLNTYLLNQRYTVLGLGFGVKYKI